MKPQGQFQHSLPAGQQVLFYVIKGEVEVNGNTAKEHQLVEMSLEGEDIAVIAAQDSQLIFCYGTPFNEPIVAHGPFVMNTEQEIREAIHDYQRGKLGSLNI